MYLYRCARRGDFDKDCPKSSIIKGDNTHTYVSGVEYVHFFRYAKDAEYYFRRNLEYIKNSNYHIGYTVIEVDEAEVIKFLGYGIYVVGQVFLEKENNTFKPILEYAIPKDLYVSCTNKYLFKVKEEYLEENIDDEVYYDRIPDEFRNDSEYDIYMNIINELYNKYDGKVELIGEEVLAIYKEMIKQKK